MGRKFVYLYYFMYLRGQNMEDETDSNVSVWLDNGYGLGGADGARQACAAQCHADFPLLFRSERLPCARYA